MLRIKTTSLSTFTTSVQHLGFLGESVVKNRLAKQETQVPPLNREAPLEKEMETHSSILAWEISWMEEPDGLQFMGFQRVRQNLSTKTTN